MQILHYTVSDLPIVKQLRQRLFPEAPVWAAEKGWLAQVDRQPVGYAFLTAVEGLPHMGEINGGVLSSWRRYGIGRALFEETKQAAVGRFTVLTAAVTELEGAGAKFLQAQGFVLEHEEVLLELVECEKLPRPQWSAGFQVIQRPPHASQRFCQLYDQAFCAHPWYQPYELSRLHPQMPDTLFLEHHGRLIGLARLLLSEEGHGQIEPLGILPSFQGQGLGRQLLLAACHYLITEGAQTLRIGAWRYNQPAVRLYQSIGFRPLYYTYYFICDL